MESNLIPQWDRPENLIPQWDRPENFADRIRVSRATVYEWLGEGMPSLKLGRSRRIDPVEAMAWLREHKAAS